jgi:hypothetical protein
MWRKQTFRAAAICFGESDFPALICTAREVPNSASAPVNPRLLWYFVIPLLFVACLLFVQLHHAARTITSQSESVP